VPRQSTDEHRTAAERDRAEHSKEVRTAREAAIVSLVNHPYICGMRDFVRTNYHWYMLFEYVNGGQMLDYIISHGKLKEKQARKFARQIASALDYCHRNSIVHRDLKIENILISKTGDIKIIDFGLSNLFSPQNHLKTFCGSLYFAAPELLQAKQYTGPEVDLWSFGIVLYVLVCGKVPFDDQSMPQLHAKIKKGYVEYPPWLSQGKNPFLEGVRCGIDLSLTECKNLISRMLVTDPKQRANLAEIMNHPWMTKGFNTPPENFLPQREPLQLPLDPAVIQKMTGFDFGTPEYITSQLTKVIESDDYQRAVRNAARKNVAQTPEHERKRGVFEFYKRRNSTTSRDTLTNSSSEAIPVGSDPINAYSPLISIYFLAREKMEREAEEKNPGALAMPQSPNEKPLKVSDLPPPEAAYTNAQSYEMPGEAPTGGRTRPRARTHGEDEVTEDIAKMSLKPPPISPAHVPSPVDQSSAKKESKAGILRRFSTRKRRDVDPPQAPPAVAISSPTEAAPRKSLSARRHKGEAPSTGSLQVSGSQKLQPELLTPPSAGTERFPRRFMSLRSTSVDRRRLTRRGISEGVQAADPPPTSGSDGSSLRDQGPVGDAASDDLSTRPRQPAARAKSLGHARRESIQARRARRDQQKESNVPEETDAELAEDAGLTTDNETMKPVFLKGLFSVSTTSSKPLPVIRTDIIRVLKQLGVDYEEVKGGFRCVHAPSLAPDEKEQGHNSAAPPPAALPHRRKISFGGVTRDPEDDDAAPNTLSPRAARLSRRADASLTNTDDSASDLDGAGHAQGALRVRGDRPERLAPPTSSSSAAPRPVGPGGTSTHVRDELSENMVLRFDIYVVKVPLIAMYGIQFKKVDGNIMVYKNMAQRILGALRL